MTLSFWSWLKRLFSKPKPEPESTKQPKKRLTLLEEHRRRYPTAPRDRLPRSFTNRPGVRKSQVELKKTGYKEDARPEDLDR